MLPAGTYYIGDLCYVVDKANGFDWGDFLDATLHNAENITDGRGTSDGYFEYEGTHFFSSHTAYGDGSYEDQEGRNYTVDAGLIGCWPVTGLGADPKMPVPEHGQVVTFAKPFTCKTCDETGGTIVIGHVRIDTGDEEVERGLTDWDEDEDED
jgi:hypothetical protein